MKKNSKSNSRRVQMVQTGVMEYNGQTYEIMLSRKTGEIAFFHEGSLMMDAGLQKELLTELLNRNRETKDA